MTTLWTVGYIIGQLPSNIILTRVRPRYWIPTMEVSVPIAKISRTRNGLILKLIRSFGQFSRSC
jgi:ACS family pantothenate transporter-like MFS transporter